MMIIMGIDEKIYERLLGHRKANEDLDQTIDRLITTVERQG